MEIKRVTENVTSRSFVLSQKMMTKLPELSLEEPITMRYILEI